MDSWEHAGKILSAAASIVDAVSRLMMAKDVERVAAILPGLRVTVEKAAADLKAALKYGRRS